MTKKMNQKGFSLVEGLLVIIALALVVFVGYYVYHSQKQTDKTYSTAAKTANSSPSPSTKSNGLAREPGKDNLKSFVLRTCSANDAGGINTLFTDGTAQTVESDNYSMEGGYAIVNVNCTLDNGNQLTSLFLKFTNGSWALLVNKPTSVGCQYLTDQGFPDKLKAPYCSNGVGGEGNF